MVRPSTGSLRNRSMGAFFCGVKQKNASRRYGNFCLIAPGLSAFLSNNYVRFKSILSADVLLVVYLSQRRQLSPNPSQNRIVWQINLQTNLLKKIRLKSRKKSSLRTISIGARSMKTQKQIQNALVVNRSILLRVKSSVNAMIFPCPAVYPYRGPPTMDHTKIITAHAGITGNALPMPDWWWTMTKM